MKTKTHIHISSGKPRPSPTMSAWKPLELKAREYGWSENDIVIFSTGELAEADTPSKEVKHVWRQQLVTLAQKNNDPRFQLYERNGYTRPEGTRGLRAAVAHQFCMESTLQSITLDDVAAAAGAKAVLAGIADLLEAGDEVIIPTPSWPSYFDLFKKGIKLITVETDGTGLLMPEHLSDIFAEYPRARMVIINSPHNPTGCKYTTTEREAVMQAFTQECNKRSAENSLLIVDDNPYGQLVFDGSHMQRGAIEKALMEKGHMVVIHAVSKEYGMAGHHVGFAITKNANVIMHIKNYNECRGTTASCDAMDLAQLAWVCGDAFIQNILEKLSVHRALMLEKVRSIPGLSMRDPQINYGWINFEGLKGKKQSNGRVIETPQDLSDWLAGMGIIAIPGAPFSAPDPSTVKDNWHMRMSFAGDIKKIEIAFDRIAEGVAGLEDVSAAAA